MEGRSGGKAESALGVWTEMGVLGQSTRERESKLDPGISRVRGEVVFDLRGKQG